MRSIIDEIDDSFDKAADMLLIYMNHSDIESVKAAIVSLRAAVDYRDKEEIFSALDMARAQLVKLRGIDAVTIGNVL